MTSRRASRAPVGVKRTSTKKATGRRRLAVLSGGGALAILAIVAAFVFASHGGGQRRAVIIDQLNDTAPNPAFAAEAQRTLRPAGYAVDYVSGSAVDVDLFRHLPDHRYDLVIVRAHSGRLQVEGQTLATEHPEFTDDAALFTSEPWSSSKYLDEQRDHRLSIARYDVRADPSFFGITPKFIRDSMQGRLGGATIVLMGCDGLRGGALATALRERGAGDVIGWDELVTAARTDDATLRLLGHLAAGGSTSQAVASTMSEIGSDPDHHSALLVYGSQTGAPVEPLPRPSAN